MNCLWLIKPAFQDNNTRLVFQFQSQSLEKGVITACTDYVTIEGLGGILYKVVSVYDFKVISWCCVLSFRIISD